MISIFFTACSLLVGAQCKDIELPVDAEQFSLFECGLYGQFKMADWLNQNPNWARGGEGRWTCAPTGHFAKA